MGLRMGAIPISRQRKGVWLLMVTNRLPVLETQHLVGDRSFLPVPTSGTPALALEHCPSTPGMKIPPLARQRCCSTSVPMEIRRMERSRYSKISSATITLPLVMKRSLIMTRAETATRTTTRQLVPLPSSTTLMAAETPQWVRTHSRVMTPAETAARTTTRRSVRLPSSTTLMAAETPQWVRTHSFTTKRPASPPLVLMRYLTTLRAQTIRQWVRGRSSSTIPAQITPPSALTRSSIMTPPIAAMRSKTRPSAHLSSLRTIEAIATPPWVPARSGIMTRPITTLGTATRQLALRHSWLTLMGVQTTPSAMHHSLTILQGVSTKPLVLARSKLTITAVTT